MSNIKIDTDVSDIKMDKNVESFYKGFNISFYDSYDEINVTPEHVLGWVIDYQRDKNKTIIFPTYYNKDTHQTDEWRLTQEVMNKINKNCGETMDMECDDVEYYEKGDYRDEVRDELRVGDVLFTDVEHDGNYLFSFPKWNIDGSDVSPVKLINQYKSKMIGRHNMIISSINNMMDTLGMVVTPLDTDVEEE